MNRWDMRTSGKLVKIEVYSKKLQSIWRHFFKLCFLFIQRENSQHETKNQRLCWRASQRGAFTAFQLFQLSLLSGPKPVLMWAEKNITSRAWFYSERITQGNIGRLIINVVRWWERGWRVRQRWRRRNITNLVYSFLIALTDDGGGMEDRKRLVQAEESVSVSPHVYLMSILNLTGVCGTATHRRAAGVCVCLCVCVIHSVYSLQAGWVGLSLCCRLWRRGLQS